MGAHLAALRRLQAPGSQRVHRRTPCARRGFGPQAAPLQSAAQAQAQRAQRTPRPQALPRPAAIRLPRRRARQLPCVRQGSQLQQTPQEHSGRSIWCPQQQGCKSPPTTMQTLSQGLPGPLLCAHPAAQERHQAVRRARAARWTCAACQPTEHFARLLEDLRVCMPGPASLCLPSTGMARLQHLIPRPQLLRLLQQTRARRWHAQARTQPAALPSAASSSRSAHRCHSSVQRAASSSPTHQGAAPAPAQQLQARAPMQA